MSLLSEVLVLDIGTQSKCQNEQSDGNRAQLSIIKQLLEAMFLAMKMCTDFPTDVIWMNTMSALSLANHIRAVADAFCPLKTNRRSASATALGWFASDTVHIVFIYISVYIIVP